MFKVMLKSSFEQLLKDQKQYGMMLQREEARKTKQTIDEMMANEFLYKPVYCFSNEWEDPIVGFVTHVSVDPSKGSPLYTLFNWLSGELCYTMAPRIWCNMDKNNDHEYSGVLPLMDINPYERWNLMNLHYSEMGLCCQPPEPDVEPELMSREALYHELMVTGFFDLVEKVMASEKDGTHYFTKSLVMAAVSANQVEYQPESSEGECHEG